MKFMILVAESESDFAKRTDEAAFAAYMAPWAAYSEALRDAGIIISGQALQGPETATTVRLRNGQREVQDGPFADAKEQLGGYFVIDVPDMATAKDWAAKAPTTASGHTIVRQVMPFDMEMEAAS